VGEQLIKFGKHHAPLWAANIVLVVSFLVYMHFGERRNEMVAEQRIITCHAVQDRANDAIDRLANVLPEYQVECQSLAAAIHRLESTVARQEEVIRSLNSVLLISLERREEK